MTIDPKKLAAEKAVEWVKDDMVVGLGTGSTAYHAIQKIGERVKEGLRVHAVATSVQSENLARELHIPIIPFGEVDVINVTIDGADEVDKVGNLIKGGGGALLREKVIAYHTETYLIVVDEKKLVTHLGRFPLPVEIVPFAMELSLKKLAAVFGNLKIRQAEGKNFITDNGNLIVDLDCYPITDPEALNTSLHLVPGVVETGLFSQKMVSAVIAANTTGEVSVRMLRSE